MPLDRGFGPGKSRRHSRNRSARSPKHCQACGRCGGPTRCAPKGGTLASIPRRCRHVNAKVQRGDGPSLRPRRFRQVGRSISERDSRSNLDMISASASPFRRARRAGAPGGRGWQYVDTTAQRLWEPHLRSKRRSDPVFNSHQSVPIRPQHTPLRLPQGLLRQSEPTRSASHSHLPGLLVGAEGLEPPTSSL